MARRTRQSVTGFNGRLTQLRKQRGWSQYELADRAGLSQRMVAYYEAQGGEPPAQVIVKFSTALEVSADVLLGLNDVPTAAPKDVRLWRRLLKVQDFSDRDRKFVIDLIDTIDAKEKAAASS